MNEPDYDSYSLEELYDAKANIDKLAYPDRLNRINELIHEKEQILKSQDIRNNNPKDSSGFSNEKVNYKLRFGILFLIFSIVGIDLMDDSHF